MMRYCTTPSLVTAASLKVAFKVKSLLVYLLPTWILFLLPSLLLRVVTDRVLWFQIAFTNDVRLPSHVCDDGHRDPLSLT